jgi:spore germination cell wall hydrolase CwlJ-like protein
MKGAAFLALLCALVVAGCGGRGSGGGMAVDTSNLSERDCLVRAMYFESNRSSHDGLMAVGTVVMNRVESDRFPNTICGVVSQHRQFAPGVVSKRLDPRQAAPAERAADAVLRGERYAPVGKAMHFHMASYKNPYPARYVAVAGGNAFYLKPGRRWRDEYTGAVIPASATASATASPVDAGPIQSLYQRAKAAAASGQTAQTCDTGTGLAAVSLACESEAEGR